MSLLEILTTFGTPLWLGYVLVATMGLRWRDDPIAFWGWVHVTGCLATALYLMFWLWIGLALPQTTCLPLLAICAGLQWRLWRRRRLSMQPPVALRFPASEAWHWVLYAALLAVLGYAALIIVSGNAEAVVSGDEIKHWTLKAKMIYCAGGLGDEYSELAAIANRPEGYWGAYDRWLSGVWPSLDEFLRRRFQSPGTNWVYHLDYPILNPLLHVWAYTCAGEVLHWQNRILIQLFGISLILILTGSLRRLTHPVVGALLLLVVTALVETRLALNKSLADGMVAAGLLLTIDALSRFRASREGRWWRLAIVGLTTLLWSKNEGLMYLLALLAGCASIKLRPDKLNALWLVLPATLVLYTWMSNAKYGFTNDLLTEESGGGAERFAPLLKFYWTDVLSGPLVATSAWELHSSFLYFLFAGLFLLQPKFAFLRPVRLVTVTIAVMSAAQFIVYLTTPHKLEWHLVHSALRISWQGLPIVVWWIAMSSGQLFEQD